MMDRFNKIYSVAAQHENLKESFAGTMEFNVDRVQLAINQIWTKFEEQIVPSMSGVDHTVGSSTKEEEKWLKHWSVNVDALRSMFAKPHRHQ